MSHSSMSGKVGAGQGGAEGGGMSDLIRSWQSGQAKRGHIGTFLAERGGLETSVWSRHYNVRQTRLTPDQISFFQ